MQSSCIRESSQAFFHGFCQKPFFGLLESPASTSITTAAASRFDFEVAMASSIRPNSQFTNHESLPSLQESFANFTNAFPQYSETHQADKIREQEYYHLSLSNHVCLDYVGHGLFSYHQQQSQCQSASIPSTSSSPPPPVDSTTLEQPFFDISFESVNLLSHIQYGGQESALEYKMRKRIMAFMNLSADDYALVFTANQSSAFRILADSYPFQSNKNLLTVYDNESEAVKMMIESSKKRGARTTSAEFSWPSLRIKSGKLLKKVECKRKKNRGLFVFPLQSRMTGARYSYLWMAKAQENGWHVLLDACALGPKDMETLGLSILKPDFLICSFFKVFGENPSGFGCLFVKKSSASVFKDTTTTPSVGIVRLAPAIRSPSQVSEESAIATVATDQNQNNHILLDSSSGPTPSQQTSTQTFEEHEAGGISRSQKAPEITELDEHSELHEIKDISGKQKVSESRATIEPGQFKITESGVCGQSELECRGLDQADSLGLILISARARYLVNWLVNALMSLQYPHSENGLSLVRIYGPKIKFDRGPAVAFNLVDWRGEKIDPSIVQKLADRNNISLSCGFLHKIWFSDKYEVEKKKVLETRTKDREGSAVNVKREKLQPGITVVTAALGFLTNFEDTYRLWAFISRFLDADFVEKERWRYRALNQETIEV